MAIEAETEALRDQEDAAERAARQMQNFADDMFNAIGNAQSLEDALNNVLSVLLRVAVQSALAGIGIGAPVFHSGGMVGGPAPVRNVHPAVFAAAPRYHNGGIAGLRPNEVPAILERGEVVVPKNVGIGGSSQVTVEGSTIVLQGSDASPEELQRILDRRDRALVSKIIALNEDNPGVFHT